MRQLTFLDIKKRLSSLSSSVNESNNTMITAANIVIESKNTKAIKEFLNNIKNQILPTQVYIDLLESAIENSTYNSDIYSITDYIIEAETKVRNAKETQTLIRRRAGNMKRKLTGKLSKKFSLESNKIKKPKNQANNITPNKSVTPKQEYNINLALECYNAILESVDRNIHCDRIIENYNRISKRFNIDSLFIENTKVNGVQDTVLELCRLIDTYNMPDYVKFNTIIETSWYGFESNNISYNKSDILEMSIDYFAFKPNGLKECKEILESSPIFDMDKDMVDKGIIMEDEPSETPIEDTLDNEDDLKDDKEENSIQETKINVSFPIVTTDKPNKNIRELNSSCVQDAINEYLSLQSKEDIDKIFKEDRENNEDTGFNKMFKKFKKEEIAKENENANLSTKLKNLVSKLYSRSVDGVLEGTPKLLVWIRSFFILGTAAVPVIGPVLMIITFIADRFIQLHYERKDVERMIKCFENEIKASKKKLSTIKDNEEKEKMKKYIKSLEEAKEKIDNYYDGLLSDEEQSKRYETMFDSEDDEDYDDIDDSDGSDLGFDDDDDFDFDFGDDDFLETSIFDDTKKVYTEFTDLITSSPITDINMYHMVKNINTEDLSSFATAVAEYPDVFYKESVYDAIINELKNTPKDNINFIERVTRTSELSNAKTILESTSPTKNPITIFDVYKYYSRLNSIYEAVLIINNAIEDKNNHYLEASFVNTLKMASIKLKQGLQKLSDKEKSISKSIDVGVNNLKKSAERSMTNDNRESIIKGSILPSASKVIKMGIMNAGIAILIHPIAAVISTLGYLATSAKYKAKERQMIIDEIEIELKMCQKYIDIAEQKNDMKALKQLLQTQRDLERQHQRIKYKMKVDFGQKVYDAKSPED